MMELDALIIKALNYFISRVDSILDDSVLSAYCFGSAIYDDFHSGYSDLDFFIVSHRELTESDFNNLSDLRNQFKMSKDPYLSVLEGEIISKSLIKNNIDSQVIY